MQPLKPSLTPHAAAARAQRLAREAAALRANLRRRKQQAQAQAETEAEPPKPAPALED